MDKEAIDKIEQLVTSRKIALQGDQVAVLELVPADTKIVDLEKHLNQPLHYRAAYSTSLISSFINYCKNTLDKKSSVFINNKEMTAIAIVDMGAKDNPEWGKHTAKLRLEKTPAYNAALDKDSDRQTQQELIDFLQDWQGSVQFYDVENNTIDFIDAINRIRKITVKAEQGSTSDQGDFNHKRSAMESIEVTSGEQPLPSYFLITTEPYVGFEERFITCSIRCMTGDNKPTLMYRIEGLEFMKEQIAEELQSKLIEAKELEKIQIHIGTMGYQ